MGRLILALVLVITAFGAAASHASAQDEKKKDRKELSLTALKQCGDTCHTVTTGTLEDSQTVLKIVQKGKGDLSEKFPLAAKTIIKNNPKADQLSIGFFPPEKFTLKQLQADLGKPDTVTKTTLNGVGEVAWQWYDWCAFGVTKDGHIIGLAADLEKVKMEEKKKP
jgi:hypothetical protein